MEYVDDYFYFSCFFLFVVEYQTKSFFFFFQAEDGIRDRTVTGVQTCALPISDRHVGPRKDSYRLAQYWLCSATRSGAMAREEDRSEERRVGKECRSRWSP